MKNILFLSKIVLLELSHGSYQNNLESRSYLFRDDFMKLYTGEEEGEEVEEDEDIHPVKRTFAE